MKRKNTTRNALVTSIISLLLCVSMLVGTTFAWFTDEVVTGMNTIAAGNLDVELLAGGVEVESDTKLFDDVEKWEPGVVVYENLQVSNVGTLALKYQMTLNFGNENDLNGHKLSEVLKVAVLNETIDETTMTRTQVLEKAKAAVAADQGTGALSNFYLTGELEAETAGSAFAVVIFWAPNDNEIDNLYNANNDKETSDGKPLHIEFGVNLQATQKMSEEDSFGDDYDEFASILPKATVNNLGAKKVTATTSFPNGNDATEYDMDVAFQFLPNETYEEAQSNGYRYWHADYVIKADKDVPANSMALAGYYAAFCKDFNNDNWVLLSSADVIPAGTEIRLVELLGGGSISVNYEEICNYGNDGIGFQCGAVDLTGANAGTTITVELRLYETTKAPDATSGTANEETGNYEVVGKYSYTFGAKKVANNEELLVAMEAGAPAIELLPNTEYRMPSNRSFATTTKISGPKSAVLDMTWGAYWDNATLSFEGITIKTSTGYATANGTNFGSDYAALYCAGVTYTDCDFEGPMRVGWQSAKFVNCTFNNLGNDYVWTYGNAATFDGCTFNSDGKALLIYSDGHGEVPAVSVTNCTFNATKSATAWAIANQSCAAIEIDNFGCGVNLTTTGNTVDSNFSGEWRIKSFDSSKDGVAVNGTAYTSIAIDGKTMTIDADRNVTVNE